jgi:hypothetical protein
VNLTIRIHSTGRVEVRAIRRDDHAGHVGRERGDFREEIARGIAAIAISRVAIVALLTGILHIAARLPLGLELAGCIAPVTIAGVSVVALLDRWIKLSIAAHDNHSTTGASTTRSASTSTTSAGDTSSATRVSPFATSAGFTSSAAAARRARENLWSIRTSGEKQRCTNKPKKQNCFHHF